MQFGNAATLRKRITTALLIGGMAGLLAACTNHANSTMAKSDDPMMKKPMANTMSNPMEKTGSGGNSGY